jgi:hypothetical protein
MKANLFWYIKPNKIRILSERRSVVKNIEQYWLYDIKNKSYCGGDGKFLKINECNYNGWKKDTVASKIKDSDYPYSGKLFFILMKTDGGIKIFQKDDEI